MSALTLIDGVCMSAWEQGRAAGSTSAYGHSSWMRAACCTSPVCECAINWHVSSYGDTWKPASESSVLANAGGRCNRNGSFLRAETLCTTLHIETPIAKSMLDGSS